MRQIRHHNKISQTGWLKQHKFISHSSGGWRSPRSRCWHGRFLRHLLVCAHVTSSLCATERALSGVSSYKDAKSVTAGSRYDLNYLLIDPISKYSHIPD